ncbi:MAG: prepilin peptidase [Proteobacteria bacterium]|nr:prepilin peptidase [Pseudomonadota bacterium]
MPLAEVLEPFAHSAVAHITAFVLGTLMGSFANVCIYRWPPSDEHPDGRSIVRPGSHCFACGKSIRWYDNIPVVSYVFLRGRCRHCAIDISPRYLLVELAMGLLFWAVYYHTVVIAFPGEPLSMRLIRTGILTALIFVLTVISFIDLDHQLILDKITYPAIPIFYGLGLLLPERGITDGLIGAALGYGLVRAVADGYYFLTKRHGLGYGDGKLLALIGALLSWKAVLASLFLGSLLGSVIGVTILVVARRRAASTGVVRGDAGRARDRAGPGSPEGESPEDPQSTETSADPDEVPLRHVALPFGPFLAMGALIYVFTEPWLGLSLARLWGPSLPGL